MTPTEERLTLLANGYSPIRNRDKRTFCPGWPSLEITEAEIKSWERKFSRDKATGIRVENGLAVIDFDINDEAAMKEIANRVFDAVPQLGDLDANLLVRNGKGAKEAWFVRTDEDFGRLHSRAWTPPGQDIDAGTHRVEIFGGASPRQFGALGAHTVADDGTVEVWYRWPERSPLDTPLADLPELTKTQFFEIIDIAERALADLGWSPVLKSTTGENDAQRVYDLTDDMSFDLQDGSRLSLLELRDLAHAEPDGGHRCSASFFEGREAVNRTRCLIGVSRAGNLTIWDSAHGATHCEASLKPRDYVEDLNRIAERLAENKSRRKNTVKPEDGLMLAAGKLLETYAFCPVQQLSVVPIWATPASACMSMVSFRTLFAANAEEEVGPRGGVKIVNPVDIWTTSERRVNVSGMRLRPDRERPTYEEDGALWVNTYAPPIHDATPTGQNVFVAFMEHLLPIDVEREWFLDWLAHKYRYPAVPGPGVIMVSKRQGAGRGTLFSIVRRLFGSAYVRKVDSATLTGDGGQSQYNTWMASALVLLIDELFNAGTSAHLWQRKKAYDRIKGLIDPSAREVEIIQKTMNNYTAQTFASFLMATNNLNALPLDTDDRRVCVLSNRDTMASRPDLDAALEPYRVGSDFTPEFVAGVAQLLEARSLASFNPFAPPPMFEGKINMIHHNATEVDEAADEALADIPGDFVTRNAFIERVKVRMGDEAREQKHLAAEARARLDRSDWVFLGRVKVKENGSKADVWARNKAAADLWAATPIGERPALLEPASNPRIKATDAQMKALGLKLSVVKGGADGGQ